MFLGHEEIGMWFTRKTTQDIQNRIRDASSTCSIENFFDSIGYHDAKTLSQSLECRENTIQELCRIAREKGMAQTWKSHIFPVIEWQGDESVNGFKTMYKIAMNFYSKNQDEFEEDERVSKRRDSERIFKSLLTSVSAISSSILQLPRISHFLDTPSTRSMLLVCQSWNRVLDQNNYVWKNLTQRIFDAVDPQDLDSLSAGWWRKRFLEYCTLEEACFALNFVPSTGLPRNTGFVSASTSGAWYNWYVSFSFTYHYYFSLLFPHFLFPLSTSIYFSPSIIRYQKTQTCEAMGWMHGFTTKNNITPTGFDRRQPHTHGDGKLTPLSPYKITVPKSRYSNDSEVRFVSCNQSGQNNHNWNVSKDGKVFTIESEHPQNQSSCDYMARTKYFSSKNFGDSKLAVKVMITKDKGTQLMDIGLVSRTSPGTFIQYYRAPFKNGDIVSYGFSKGTPRVRVNKKTIKGLITHLEPSQLVRMNSHVAIAVKFTQIQGGNDVGCKILKSSKYEKELYGRANRAIVDPVLSTGVSFFHRDKAYQKNLQFVMDVPRGRYFVLAAVGDPMFGSEHDLYVNGKELLPASTIAARKDDMERKDRKTAKKKRVDLSPTDLDLNKPCLEIEEVKKIKTGPVKWSCKACTFLNASTSSACVICTAARPVEDEESETKKTKYPFQFLPTSGVFRFLGMLERERFFFIFFCFLSLSFSRFSCKISNVFTLVFTFFFCIS